MGTQIGYKGTPEGTQIGHKGTPEAWPVCVTWVHGYIHGVIGTNAWPV